MAVNNIRGTPARKLAVCILVVDTPIKQKPKEVGNRLGKTLPFITVNLCSLFIGKSVSVESTW